jgi:hypothetical protein
MEVFVSLLMIFLGLVIFALAMGLGDWLVDLLVTFTLVLANWLAALIGLVVIFLVLVVLPAALVGLLAWLPPLRRAGRASRRNRWVLVGLLGLLGFALVLAAAAWLVSGTQIALASIFTIDPPAGMVVPYRPPWQEWTANQQAMRTELILRDLAPGWRACHSTISVGCQAADYVVWLAGGQWVPAGLALAALLISAGLGWWLTRPAPVEAQAGVEPGSDASGAGG